MATQELTQDIEIYQPSGYVSLKTVLIPLLFGSAAAILAALIASVIWQITGLYLMILFPLGMGFLIAIALNAGNELAKGRNSAVGFAIAVFAGALSYVAMHYFDSLASSAPDLMSYLRQVNEQGYDFLVGGLPAWLTWLIELGVVIGTTVYFGMANVTYPFCEECDQACKDPVLLFATSNDRVDEMKAALAEGDIPRLIGLQSEELTERDQLKVDFIRCRQLAHGGYVTLTSITPKGKGDDKEENVLVAYALVGADGARALAESRND